MKHRVASAFLPLALCLVGAAAPSAAVPPEEAEAWRQDLLFVQREMPQVHPDLFHTLAQEVFETSIHQLIESLPSLSQYEIITELAAIVAAVGDGHTRLTLPLVEGSGFFSGHSSTPPPTSAAMLMHPLPIRLTLLEDGLFVQQIEREQAEFLGARVERIGNLPVEDAIQRMSRVVHHDNESQLRGLLPSRLVIAELLAALGITEDPSRVEWQLRDGSGTVRTLSLTPSAEGASVDWVDWTSLANGVQLSLRHPERNFWFEPIEGHDAVFCQYNEVYDQADESIAAFSARLTDFIETNAVGVLVLDLRNNRGGDNSLNRSFLHALLCCPSLQDPGSLYVIIGRNTFSAAMMFAIDLEKHTNAIFVGEPTGGRPNAFGDSRKIRLPNSGLTVRVSTLYWQYSGPKDTRPWLPPHLPVQYTSEDVRAGRDAALGRILELESASSSRAAAGNWKGHALGYEIAVHLHGASGSWQAEIDFPGEGAMGLPLVNVQCDSPSVAFDFINGESTISFRGTLHEDTIIGSVTYRDQSSLWVMTAVE